MRFSIVLGMWMSVAAVAASQEAVDVGVAVGPEVDTESFQPALSAYGQWVEVPGYGSVWRPYPRVVGADFVPYSSGGHWVYTDMGWAWASDYAWGWAAFHYGNWVDTEGGWAWIPGRVWAPAWVEWRSGGEYIGWAPLGPRGAVVVREQPVRYTYVQVNNFTAVNVRAHVIVGAEAETITLHTQALPSARVVNGRYVAPVNAGPRPTVIAQATGRPVTAVPVHSVATAAPPASVRGVHYANGASAEHPFATQKTPAQSQKNVAAVAQLQAAPARATSSNPKASEPAHTATKHVASPAATQASPHNAAPSHARAEVPQHPATEAMPAEHEAAQAPPHANPSKPAPAHSAPAGHGEGEHAK